MVTYLLVDIAALFIPIIFSFHPKLNFYETWHAFFPAMLITAALFIMADILFTKEGVWGFNPVYVLGIHFFSLPIEEYLFFFCIPYSCIFTYYCLKVLVKKTWNERQVRLIVQILSLILFVIGVINYNRLYTSSTFISLSLFLFLQCWFNKSFSFSRFYQAYLVLLIPFFICNGILTGTGLASPIVWYNNQQNLGIRVLTIPIEDFFYGMLLILMNAIIYEQLLSRKKLQRGN